MRRLAGLRAILVAFLLLMPSLALAETRIGLVVGNAAYPGKPIATAVNDAGLIAEMLGNAGFEVYQARDTDEATLRGTVRQFLDRVATAGPDTVAFVYLSGYALQFESENYFLPVSARLQRPTDIPIQGMRVSDITRTLAGLPARARVVVIDASRLHPFDAAASPGQRGLGLMEAERGMLVASSAAPGMLVPDEQGPYGIYATAFLEMAVQPGLPLDQLFQRLRLRVHEQTRGAVTPWHSDQLDQPVVLFQAVEAAAAPPLPPPQRQPIRQVSAEEAYLIAVERDTVGAYEEFLGVYANHPLAQQVWRLLALRREQVIWNRTVLIGSPEAFWTYLRFYPSGPHAGEARRWLRRLNAPVDVPVVFAAVVYNVGPPMLDELAILDQIYRGPPIYAAPLPPPPAPVYILPPRERVFYELPPPALPAWGILPIPALPFRVPVAIQPPPAVVRPGMMPALPGGVTTFGGQNRPAMPGMPQGQRPGQAGQPGQPPGMPGQQGQPGQPGQMPGMPGGQGQRPGQPGQAGQPGQPGQPPGMPGQQGQPGQPGQPGQAGQPGQPPTLPGGGQQPGGQGQRPGQAGQPGQPGQPGQAGQPGQPPTLPGGGQQPGGQGQRPGQAGQPGQPPTLPGGGQQPGGQGQRPGQAGQPGQPPTLPGGGQQPGGQGQRPGQAGQQGQPPTLPGGGQQPGGQGQRPGQAGQQGQPPTLPGGGQQPGGQGQRPGQAGQPGQPPTLPGGGQQPGGQGQRPGQAGQQPGIPGAGQPPQRTAPTFQPPQRAAPQQQQPPQRAAPTFQPPQRAAPQQQQPPQRAAPTFQPPQRAAPQQQQPPQRAAPTFQPPQRAAPQQAQQPQRGAPPQAGGGGQRPGCRVIGGREVCPPGRP